MPAFDAAVIGAGVFGSWIARTLHRGGASVVLLDAYGAGNSRASSGGESRLIRIGYGPDEIYSRWALFSLDRWKQFFADVKDAGQPLFHQTGVLWLSRENDTYYDQTVQTLRQLDVWIEELSPGDLGRRYPQIALEPDSWGSFEPRSGVLMARRAVQALVEAAVREGVRFVADAVDAPPAASHLDSVTTRGGERITAIEFVFACGPWLPKVFPDLLGDRIHPTRQEVLFFGLPPGDRRFSPPAMPAWVNFADGLYGTPDLEGRGFKVGLDQHGPPFDPDSGDRIVRPEVLEDIRERVGRRFPALKDAPIIESRVCQYENTSNGDLLIDRHPAFDNVWLVGGGSGHGFKHGPAVGEYVAGVITGRTEPEPRFSLATKGTSRQRAVY